MRFEIRHDTIYSYASPVALGQHRLRLTPRAGQGRLISHDLDIGPEPAIRSDLHDGEGQVETLLDFQGTTDRLEILSRFTFETAVPPPLPEAGALPMLPWPVVPSGGWLDLADPGPEVTAFGAGIRNEAGNDPLAFLDRLNRVLYERTDRQIRPKGHAQSPFETLTLARGACRDLTVLFIALCRAQGMPARFVSGYQARAQTPDGQRHLHAWPEVLLPGHGWAGFDPTHATRVSDGHVALYAAAEQAGTMPLDGGYFGEPVASSLEYRVEISVA